LELRSKVEVALMETELTLEALRAGWRKCAMPDEPLSDLECAILDVLSVEGQGASPVTLPMIHQRLVNRGWEPMKIAAGRVKGALAVLLSHERIAREEAYRAIPEGNGG